MTTLLLQQSTGVDSPYNSELTRKTSMTKRDLRAQVLNLQLSSTSSRAKPSAVGARPGLSSSKSLSRLPDAQQGASKVRRRSDSTPTPPNAAVAPSNGGADANLTPQDFEFLRLIGHGSFARAYQVRKRDTGATYAMKVLSKSSPASPASPSQNTAEHLETERAVLAALDSPFLLHLHFSFQTDRHMYLVTDYFEGGELFWHIQRDGRFTEERARFYIAELVLALEHLHERDIFYRDLKPENILLGTDGHLALCDFGFSKPHMAAHTRTRTFCGTAEYLAPELLRDERGYTRVADFWALGVLLFEMRCGWSPFYAEDAQGVYTNVCVGKVRFPKGVFSEDGKAFVKGLLNRNASRRLGAQDGAAELKAHPWFAGLDWSALARKEIAPPFVPEPSLPSQPDAAEAALASEDGVNLDGFDFDAAASVPKRDGEEGGAPLAGGLPVPDMRALGMPGSVPSDVEK